MGKVKNPLVKKGQKYKVKEKKIISVVDEEATKLKSNENKLYWIRVLSGFAAALIGRLALELIGWKMLYWMVGWWFGFPWVISFLILRIPYDKVKWDWKMIMKTGIGAYFFIFMITATIAHTLLVMQDPTLQYTEIFANPISDPLGG